MGYGSEPGRGGTGREPPATDALSLAELGEELADATETTAEAIGDGAAELGIEPPADATVLDE